MEVDMFCEHGAPLGGSCGACDKKAESNFSLAGLANCGCVRHAEDEQPCPHDIALLRQKAAEPGFFRACLGEDVADDMASGKMDDETTLQRAYAVASAIEQLSH